MHTNSWTPPIRKVFWAVFLTQHLHKTPSTWWLHFCYLRGAKYTSNYLKLLLKHNSSQKNAVQNNCVVLVRNQYWKLVIMCYSALNKEIKKNRNLGHSRTIYFGWNFWATSISLAALCTLSSGKILHSYSIFYFWKNGDLWKEEGQLPHLAKHYIHNQWLLWLEHPETSDRLSN